jgi:cytoskeletal protein CcmA (bactofilin family)
MDQTHIARTVVIKGQVSGSESLFVDGRIEGTISFPDHRVTIGRNGNVAANITAKELVIMGKVQGNVDCADRLDIRSEGMLSGDVITHRKDQKMQHQQNQPKAAEETKTMATTANA